MSENSSSSSSSVGGIGLTGALTVAFVVLKLTGHIAWSWWWVASPIWISLLAIVAMFLAFAAMAFVVAYWPLKKTTRLAMDRVKGRS